MDNKKIIIVLISLILIGIAGFFSIKYLNRDSEMVSNPVSQTDINIKEEDIPVVDESTSVEENTSLNDAEIDKELENINLDSSSELEEEIN